MKTVEFLDRLRQLDVKLSTHDSKLKCQAPPGVLTPDLQVELAERKAEILAFLQTVSQQKRSQITPVSRDRQLPLSSAQKRPGFCIS